MPAKPKKPPALTYAHVLWADAQGRVDANGVVFAGGRVDADGMYVKWKGGEWRGKGGTRGNEFRSDPIKLLPGTDYVVEVGAFKGREDGPATKLIVKTQLMIVSSVTKPLAAPTIPPEVPPPVPIPTPPPVPPVVPPPTYDVLLTSLVGVTLQQNTRYLLAAPGSYTFSQPITIPSGTTLDLASAHIYWDSAVNGSAPFRLVGQRPTLRGGIFHFVNETLAYQSLVVPKPDSFANTQRGWEVDYNASDAIIEYVTFAVVDRATQQGYGGAVLNGTTRTIIRHCDFNAFWGYATFAGGKDVTIEDCTTSYSSRETSFRFHGVDGLTVRRCTITNTGPKFTATKIHDGRNVLVEDCIINGVAGNGPLGGGDGGQGIGIGRFYGNSTARDAYGTPTDVTATPAMLATLASMTTAGATSAQIVAALAAMGGVTCNVANTLAVRAGFLAKRLTNITYRNCTFVGPFGVDAGIEGVQRIEGGSMSPFAGKTGAGNVEAQPFQRLNKRYPLPALTLPNDIIRPAAAFELVGVALFGAVTNPRGLIPSTFTLTGCTYNGVALANGPGLLNWS